MSNHPDVFAVIVAGGSGNRMGTVIPKQFLPLCGRPVIWYSIQAFREALESVTIILVLPDEHLDMANDLIGSLHYSNDIEVVGGGPTRFASVSKGLQLVTEPSVVMVHDGARPLVTTDLIRRCYDGARMNGSAVPVIRMSDSVRQVSGLTSRTITRDDLRSVQTPQAFNATLLKQAYAQPYLPVFTDEASVVEWNGGIIHLVDGTRSNIKITTPEDLIVAEALLQKMNPE